jgi:hypothetical protein
MQNTHGHKSMRGAIQKSFQGEDFAGKNVDKKMKGRNGKSQVNQGRLRDIIGRNDSN